MKTNYCCYLKLLNNLLGFGSSTFGNTGFGNNQQNNTMSFGGGAFGNNQNSAFGSSNNAFGNKSFGQSNSMFGNNNQSSFGFGSNNSNILYMKINFFLYYTYKFFLNLYILD